MIDPFGRHITYLRLSVTDRCDLRCTYCMAEKMTFLPRKDLLTLEELDRLATCFIEKGVKKLRITGGEPLVRKNIIRLFNNLGRHVKSGALEELTLTTNGTQLKHFADDLFKAGVRRINVSIDSLDLDDYKRITRGGNLPDVLEGIQAAIDVGLEVKLNCVALKNDNVEMIEEMMVWAHARNCTMTLIEVMPLGDVGADRLDQYIPLTDIKDKLQKKYTLTAMAKRTGGPSRYMHVKETGGEIGFITPLTQNFCEGCNRVRVTCTGKLYMCLGHGDAADLRQVMRQEQTIGGHDALAQAGALIQNHEMSFDNGLLKAAIDEAITRKPKAHDFKIEKSNQRPALARHMSMTGG